MRSSSSPILLSKTQKSEAPGFDKLAPAYRWMEYLSFGPALSRCRSEFLSELAHCRNALVIGDGDGRFTARLLETNPVIRVEAVDASPAMLRALVRSAGSNAPRVRAEVADARAWQTTSVEPYDLIVTHFFLDCLTTDEVRSLAEKIRPASVPNTLWVVSDFTVPRSFVRRIFARALISTLYRAFGLLTGLEIRALPDHANALAGSGFRMMRQRTRLWGLLACELWTIDITRK